MAKILIITVGGSDEPIVAAIKSYKPDFIYFVCSAGNSRSASTQMVDGKGDVCIRQKEIRCKKCHEVIVKGEYYPSIISQSQYPTDRYQKIEILNPDNFQDVYVKVSNIVEDAKKKGHEIIADFTGGTKTMSSVLAMISALNFEIKPSLTIGQRNDLIKTKIGSTPSIINFDVARSETIFTTVNILISKYLYFPAKSILETLLRFGFEEHIAQKIRNKCIFCDAFGKWDIFEYEKAYEILKNSAKQYKEEFSYLLKLLGKEKCTGYEPVFDLISNAERQSQNGFYDNAVARIYRALELFAQIRLKKEYSIDPSKLQESLEKTKDPDKWKSKKNEKGEIKIGLKDAYELLGNLRDTKDIFGLVYIQHKNKFENMLQIRNNSKLAHGNQPISEKECTEMMEFNKNFIQQCCKKARIKIEYLQLPNKIQE
jgi:CRISPR-associated protein (TIGR02710 family)